MIRLHSSAVLAVHSQCTILEPPRVKTQIWQRSRMPAAHLADDVLGALLQIPHRLGAAQGKRRMYGGTMVALAEYGSFGVEFWALSNCTGNPVYAETAERIYR